MATESGFSSGWKGLVDHQCCARHVGHIVRSLQGALVHQLGLCLLVASGRFPGDRGICRLPRQHKTDQCCDQQSRKTEESKAPYARMHTGRLDLSKNRRTHHAGEWIRGPLGVHPPSPKGIGFNR